MDAPVIGITGATGEIGGGISRCLEQAGEAHRLLVRSPARVQDRVEASHGLLSSAAVDFSRPEEAVAGLRGVDVLFFVSATETEDRATVQERFVDAVAEADVRHVVYLSFAAAGPEATFTYARTHWKTEQAIRAAGMDFTFFRDSFYLDVLLDFAGEQRTILGPAGDGRVAAVARADVIDAAAAVLQDPRAHAGRTYTLTGPAALSMAEVAQVLTETTGEPYSYQDQTLEQARASRAAWDPEEWMMEGWISTYTAIASGELAQTTDDVERLTGHAPRSLAEVVHQQIRG